MYKLNDRVILLTTESKENKLKTFLIEIMRLLFNHPIHEINIYYLTVRIAEKLVLVQIKRCQTI